MVDAVGSAQHVWLLTVAVVTTKDMKKLGGPGKKKQCCTGRKCVQKGIQFIFPVIHYHIIYLYL